MTTPTESVEGTAVATALELWVKKLPGVRISTVVDVAVKCSDLGVQPTFLAPPTSWTKARPPRRLVHVAVAAPVFVFARVYVRVCALTTAGCYAFAKICTHAALPVLRSALLPGRHYGSKLGVEPAARLLDVIFLVGLLPRQRQ